MMVVLTPGSQRQEGVRVLGRSESLGLCEHPVEARERTLIGNIDEKVSLAFGGEVYWL